MSFYLSFDINWILYIQINELDNIYIKFSNIKELLIETSTNTKRTLLQTYCKICHFEGCCGKTLL